MDLPDNDLLDLLLRRREPDGELDQPDVKAVLDLLRQRP
jgi:antitoxin CptB